MFGRLNPACNLAGVKVHGRELDTSPVATAQALTPNDVSRRWQRLQAGYFSFFLLAAHSETTPGNLKHKTLLQKTLSSQFIWLNNKKKTQMTSLSYFFSFQQWGVQSTEPPQGPLAARKTLTVRIKVLSVYLSASTVGWILNSGWRLYYNFSILKVWFGFSLPAKERDELLFQLWDGRRNKRGSTGWHPGNILRDPVDIHFQINCF